MTNEPQAIEVEVVEIDGISPLATSTHPEEPPPQRQWQDWQKWQGHIRQLDSRWWPLWVFLGAIGILLLLTLGIFIGIIFLIFRILRGIVRAIFH